MKKLTLTPDSSTANLKIDDTFTAIRLQTLITELAALRSDMEPQIPHTPPKPTDPNIDDLHLSVHDDPDIQLKLLRDGRIRFWFRSSGLGWLVFNVPVRQACAIRDYLNANTPDLEGDPGFFTEDAPDGHGSH